MYLSHSHRKITERVVEIRKKNGKGVTATVASILLMSVAVAGAGTYYTVQSDLIEESKDEKDFEALDSTPISIESCWTNRTSTYLSIRNTADQKALSTESISLYVEGEKIISRPNKEIVNPKRTFLLESRRYLSNGVTPRVENEDYYATKFCGSMIPGLEVSFTDNVSQLVEKKPVKFEDTSDGIISDYSWSSPDTTLEESNGEEIEHTFENSGSYEVKLQVEDVLNQTGKVTRQMNVLEEEFFQVTLQSHNSPVDVGNDFQVNYRVDNTGEVSSSKDIELIVDGTVRDTNTLTIDGGESKTGILYWPTSTGDSGTHPYKVQTEDDNESGTVTVEPNSDPSSDFSYSTSKLQVDFSEQASDSDGSVASYFWNFGDGSTSTSPNPSHTYSSAGTYNVDLEVTDDDGATDTKTKSVTVTDNYSPVASINVNPSNADVGESVSLDGSGSNDPDGSIASYDWYLKSYYTDGVDATGSTHSNSFSENRWWKIKLEVADDDGATDTATAWVQIWEPVSNCNDLQNMKNDILGHYYLTSNIDCNGASFEPLPDWEGTLDGRGNYIRGIEINKPDKEFTGFISTTEGQTICSDGSGCFDNSNDVYRQDALIENIGFRNLNITGGEKAGTVTGYGANLNLEKTYVTGGRVETTESTDWATVGAAGGMIGWQYSADVSDSYSAVTVEGPSTYGFSLLSGSGSCNDCYFDKDTAGTSNGAGTALSTSEIKDLSNYGLSSSNWETDSSRNSGYPFLK